jgi:hypothetical protein
MKPKSRFKWTQAWTAVEGQDRGTRTLRLADRFTGEILGFCPRVELHGTTAWEAIVVGGDDELLLGHYDHWVPAKRAVERVVEKRSMILGPGVLEEVANAANPAPITGGQGSSTRNNT